MTELAKTRKLNRLRRARTVLRNANVRLSYRYPRALDVYTPGDSEAVWLIHARIVELGAEIDRIKTCPETV